MKGCGEDDAEYQGAHLNYRQYLDALPAPVGHMAIGRVEGGIRRVRYSDSVTCWTTSLVVGIRSVEPNAFETDFISVSCRLRHMSACSRSRRRTSASVRPVQVRPNSSTFLKERTFSMQLNMRSTLPFSMCPERIRRRLNPRAYRRSSTCHRNETGVLA